MAYISFSNCIDNVYIYIYVYHVHSYWRCWFACATTYLRQRSWLGRMTSVCCSAPSPAGACRITFPGDSRQARSLSHSHVMVWPPVLSNTYTVSLHLCFISVWVHPANAFAIVVTSKPWSPSQGRFLGKVEARKMNQTQDSRFIAIFVNRVLLTVKLQSLSDHHLYCSGTCCSIESYLFLWCRLYNQFTPILDHTFLLWKARKHFAHPAKMTWFYLRCSRQGLRSAMRGEHAAGAGLVSPWVGGDVCDSVLLPQRLKRGVTDVAGWLQGLPGIQLSGWLPAQVLCFKCIFYRGPVHCCFFQPA